MKIPNKWRGKSLLSIEEMDEREIKHKDGWVYGIYIDGYIIGEVIEATDQYISISGHCAVDEKSVGMYYGADVLDANDNGKTVELYQNDIVRNYVYHYQDHYDQQTLGFIEQEIEFEGYIYGIVNWNPSQGFHIKKMMQIESHTEEVKPSKGILPIVQSRTEKIGNITDKPNFFVNLQEKGWV